MVLFLLHTLTNNRSCEKYEVYKDYDIPQGKIEGESLGLEKKFFCPFNVYPQSFHKKTALHFVNFVGRLKRPRKPNTELDTRGVLE